jgi:hypothetical protein
LSYESTVTDPVAVVHVGCVTVAVGVDNPLGGLTVLLLVVLHATGVVASVIVIE